MISIKKTTKLTAKELGEFQALHSICSQKDGFSTHFYWISLSERSGGVISDFMFYVGDQLIGALSFFMFENDSAEICAMVHPEHRKQHVFSRLMEEAQLEMKMLKLTHCFFISHPKAQIAKKILRKVHAKYHLTEYKLQCFSKPKISDAPAGFSFSKAKKSDAKSVAQLGVTAFSVIYDDEFERVGVAQKDKRRGVYLAYIGKSLIGKIHYLHLPDETLLHDFCLLPDYQGKGLSRFFLQSVVSRLFNYKAEPKTLTITSEKPDAKKLYLKAGFKEVEAQESWRMNLVALHQTHSVLH